MLLLQTNPSATFLLAAERQKRPNGDGDFFQWISQMALEQHIENSSFSDVLPGRKRLSWNTWKFHYQVVLLENPFMACMSSFFSKDPESERKILLDCLKITQLWHFHHFFFCTFETDLSGNTIWLLLAILTIFFHSKCKRSSICSQCWMRLFSVIFKHCAIFLLISANQIISHQNSF